MKALKIVVILLFGGLLSLYGQRSIHSSKPSKKMKKEIYFAGGCFWGTEHFMKQIRGVKDTEVGYANSNESWKGKKPSYKEVCSGATGCAETVKVVYHPAEVDLTLLVDLFFKTIDPTSLNRQGNDRGTQYRSGIYFTEAADEPVLKAAVAALSEQYAQPVVVEIQPLRDFYKAEVYHQDYLEHFPRGYCHISPDLFEMARKANPEERKSPRVYTQKSKEELRRELTPQQYAVTQENATERAFTNEYWNEEREGIYVDITTGEPLFVSTDKFKSLCGWPSFSKPISNDLVVEKTDRSLGMQRTEVRSKTGNAHLGHVFTDGPADRGGLRYCINSASLRFIPKQQMKEEGYGQYLPLLKTQRK